MTEGKAVAITARLDNLDSAPEFRGSVDVVDNGVIRGWCISATDPTAPVTLDIYLADVHVGTTATAEPRADISRVLSFPVSAGFRFSVEDCSSSSLAKALKALVETPEDALGKLLAVVIHGDRYLLPYKHDFHVSSAEAGHIGAILQRKLEQIGKNQRVAIRDQLLTHAPVTTVEREDDVKVIAFYLPQFHPIPENNDWWGEGFTEWTNVTSAKPRFKDHYQPRLPADFGYYDLRLDAVQEGQVELAKKFGISAFCYYYYWFSGTKLLTMPLDRHVDRNYDLDFCLCWANENWSRRWDGSEQDILMAQQHSEADDVEFIHSVIPYFSSERYIRIAGAPLLIVYRISLLSNPSRVIQRWKEAVKEAGFPDLHVCMAETFGLNNPHEFGADSSCQFPPHGVSAADHSMTTEGVEPGFTGKIYDYVEVAANEVRRQVPGHIRYRTAMPSWDNSSRKGLAGHVFHNASPEVFEAWMSFLCAQARRVLPAGHRYVFVNAWNEWAEGAYLEPDRRYGHDYLKAVRNALLVQNALLGEAMLPPEDDGTEFRDKVLRVVTTLANANRQLLRFATEYERRGATLSPFIARPSNAIRRLTPRHDAAIQIDVINGRVTSHSDVTVLRQQQLSLAGWLHIPGVALTQQLPMFVQLLPVDAEDRGADYIATIYEREQRQDVSAAFGEETLGYWYGFRYHGNLENVPAGSYRIAILVASPLDARSAFGIESKLVIHVG